MAFIDAIQAVGEISDRQISHSVKNNTRSCDLTNSLRIVEREHAQVHFGRLQNPEHQPTSELLATASAAGYDSIGV